MTVPVHHAASASPHGRPPLKATSPPVVLLSSNLDLQSTEKNGPYAAHTLYFEILGHYSGHFWRSWHSCAGLQKHRYHFEPYLRYKIPRLTSECGTIRYTVADNY